MQDVSEPPGYNRPLFWCLSRARGGKSYKSTFFGLDNQPYYDVRDKPIIYVPMIRVLGKHQRSDYRLNLCVHQMLANNYDFT